MIKLTEDMPWEKAAPLWQRISSQFAKGANGTVHVFKIQGELGLIAFVVKLNIQFYNKKVLKLYIT